MNQLVRSDSFFVEMPSGSTLSLEKNLIKRWMDSVLLGSIQGLSDPCIASGIQAFLGIAEGL